ncbi:hypothetical protein SAMN05216262_11119 [Colwellia chukchiensis]|uniref:Uncharacterized protein n=1 Tax=Colwellia chukchiensis TaxID=641665 RepID=A0A1H7Q9A1_9GAMM|nr:hypothetical protein SAMN05216262_11119 [Colwellia chukchiensis]
MVLLASLITCLSTRAKLSCKVCEYDTVHKIWDSDIFIA